VAEADSPGRGPAARAGPRPGAACTSTTVGGCERAECVACSPPPASKPDCRSCV